ncbi:MAG: DUF350 domain-containing protein [Flavobacteriales bacterium]|nr:DUF350 domain-containing protein [Flavobacteriales bacterium]
METSFEFVWHSAVFLLVCLTLFFVAQLAFRMFNPSFNVNMELTEKDNLSFFLGYLGYFLGFLMIIGGVMKSEGSGDFYSEIILSLIYGGVGIVVLNLTSIILDKIIHPKLSLWDEIIAHGNASVGISKGAHYFSTGLIVGGVMLTEVNKPLEAGIFLLLALAIGSIGFMYYDFITPFKVRKEIYNGNVAAAIGAGGAQIAFAILIFSGFQIIHSSWQESMMIIGVDIAAGFILLPLIRWVVDKLFIPSAKLTDEIVNQEKPNIGAGLFEAASYIGGALLFIWCWNL